MAKTKKKRKLPGEPEDIYEGWDKMSSEQKAQQMAEAEPEEEPEEKKKFPKPQLPGQPIDLMKETLGEQKASQIIKSETGPTYTQGQQNIIEEGKKRWGEQFSPEEILEMRKQDLENKKVQGLIYDEAGNVKGGAWKGKEIIGNLGAVKEAFGPEKFAQMQAQKSIGEQAAMIGNQETALTSFEQYKQQMAEELQARLQENKYAGEMGLGEVLIEGAGAATSIVGGPVGSRVARALKLIAGVKLNVGENIEELNSLSGEKYKNSKTNLNSYITDINQGGNSVRNMELYRNEINKMMQDYSRLKVETMQDVHLFTKSEGYDQMVAYEQFFQEILPIMDTQMQQAILNPNPNKILVDEYDFS